MGIPTFDVDMNIIGRLGDYPGADDGMKPDVFKAQFDLAGKLIQEYINTILIPHLDMTTDVTALVAGVQKQLGMVFTAEQARFFQKVFALSDFVLNSGSSFYANKLSDTLVSVSGGEAVMQGRLISLEPEVPVNIPVLSGTSGTFRNDLICLRFSRTEDGTESKEIVLLEGYTNQTAGIDPVYMQDDINTGAAATRDFPLYRIRVEGITASLESLFTPSNSVSDVIADTAADKVVEKLSVWEGGSY